MNKSQEISQRTLQPVTGPLAPLQFNFTTTSPFSGEIRFRIWLEINDNEPVDVLHSKSQLIIIQVGCFKVELPAVYLRSPVLAFDKQALAAEMVDTETVNITVRRTLEPKSLDLNEFIWFRSEYYHCGVHILKAYKKQDHLELTDQYWPMTLDENPTMYMNGE